MVIGLYLPSLRSTRSKRGLDILISKASILAALAFGLHWSLYINCSILAICCTYLFFFRIFVKNNNPDRANLTFQHPLNEFYCYFIISTHSYTKKTYSTDDNYNFASLVFDINFAKVVTEHNICSQPCLKSN
jgi:hypothetical protein